VAGVCAGCGHKKPGSAVGGEWICKPCRKRWWQGKCSDCGAKADVIAHGFDWVCSPCRKIRRHRASEKSQKRKTVHLGKTPAKAGRSAPPMDLIQVNAWRQAGFYPQDASLWKRSGFQPNAARSWCDAGFLPSRARSWQIRGFTLVDAKAWAFAGFDPQQATDWREACGEVTRAGAFVRGGFALPTAKVLWAAGVDPRTAGQWVGAGLTPEDAAEYFKAGKTLEEAVACHQASIEAKEREEAAKREAGAAEAMRLEQERQAAERKREEEAQAEIDRLERQREELRTRIAGDLTAVAATAAKPDRLFGSPRTRTALAAWSANIGLPPMGGNVSQRLAADLDGTSFKTWSKKGPTRITLAEVHSVRAILASTCGEPSGSWAATVRQLLYTAATYVVQPQEVDLYLAGEPLTTNLAADIRLPLRQVVVLFGADFWLPSSRLTLLPRSTRNQLDALAYDRYLATGRTATALFGLVLVADEDDHPRDEVGWLIRVGSAAAHLRLLVPGFRSRSPLGQLVQNVDAAVCWAGWNPTDDSPPQTRVGRPSRRRRTTQATAPNERMINIGTKRRVRYAQSTTGGAKAAHQRRGHWRRQRIGTRAEWHYEVRWIRPTLVGAHLADTPGRIYRIEF
jgi:hypothetical protein